MSRSVTGAALEAKFRALVDEIGGDAYSSGAPYSAAGALGRDALSPGLRISNAAKNEPYALFAIQLRGSKILRDGDGATSNGNNSDEIYLPSWMYAASADTSIVAANVAFAAQSAGTDVSVRVIITKYTPALASTAVTDQTVAGLASATFAGLTVANGSMVGFSRLIGVLDVTAVTGGGASDYIVDPVITVICKSKHVA
jgi:hypothetical protein